MTKTKVYDTKKNAKWKALFGGVAIVAGASLELFGVGNLNIGKIYLSGWLFTVGLIALLVAAKGYFWSRELKYDERTQLLILKSSRNTFSVLIYLAIGLMLAGTFYPLKVDLANITGGLLFFAIAAYRFFYWSLSKKY